MMKKQKAFSTNANPIVFRITCAALQVGERLPRRCMTWRTWDVVLEIIDLVISAVLAGLGGKCVVVADRAGQVVHQTQFSLHWTPDCQGDRVKLCSALDKLWQCRETIKARGKEKRAEILQKKRRQRTQNRETWTNVEKKNDRKRRKQSIRKTKETHQAQTTTLTSCKWFTNYWRFSCST